MEVYFVYILYSHKDKKTYVGCTSDLEKRIERHNKGYVLATRFRRPFSLIYTESFCSKIEAFSRERFLKSLWGARLKKKVVQNYLNKINLNDQAKPISSEEIGRPN